MAGAPWPGPASFLTAGAGILPVGIVGEPRLARLTRPSALSAVALVPQVTRIRQGGSRAWAPSSAPAYVALRWCRRYPVVDLHLADAAMDAYERRRFLEEQRLGQRALVDLAERGAASRAHLAQARSPAPALARALWRARPRPFAQAVSALSSDIAEVASDVEAEVRIGGPAAEPAEPLGRAERPACCSDEAGVRAERLSAGFGHDSRDSSRAHESPEKCRQGLGLWAPSCL